MAENIHYERAITALHLGADGGTTFVDKSPTPKTLTVTTPTITSASSPFAGQNSAVFNGTSDKLAVATGELFGGLLTYTIELWFRSANVTGTQPLISKSDGTNVRFFLSAVGGTGLSWLNMHTQPGSISVNPTAAFLVNTWHHVAVVFNGAAGNMVIYYDGTSVGSSAVPGTALPYGDAAYPLYIGHYVNNNTYFNGSIAEVWVYPGVAKYTSNFTPMTSALFDFPSIYYPSRTNAAVQGYSAYSHASLIYQNR